MRLATWNINSVRLRLPLLLAFLEEYNPDVFCLQETKTPDIFFPHEALIAKGYPYFHLTGMKGYNGVCIFSRYPLETTHIHSRCQRDDARHISAIINCNHKSFELHNIYIPAGGYEPDPILNDKFQHKLDFIDDLTTWFSKHRSSDQSMIVVGDLNVAPLEHDVWDHRKMLNVVSHTPIEVEKFTSFYQSMYWTDAVRHFVPETEKLYSWWSYRAADWNISDKGRRLDHIWVTKDLTPTLQSQIILRSARNWERPSDHVPIIVDLNL